MNSEQAWIQIRSRAESERHRFKNLYDVHVERLANYDLVLDTSQASVDLLCDRIIEALKDPARLDKAEGGPPRLYISPAHVYPTEDIRVLRDLDGESMDRLNSREFLEANPVQVCYSYPYYYAVDGHKRLSAAIMRNNQLTPAQLVGEGDDAVYGGLTADELFADLVQRPSKVWDWADAHKISLDVPS